MGLLWTTSSPINVLVDALVLVIVGGTMDKPEENIDETAAVIGRMVNDRAHRVRDQHRTGS